MAPVTDAPCVSWIDDWAAVGECGCQDASGIDEIGRQLLMDYASEVMWRLSKYRYNECEITRRPCVVCTCGRRPCGCRRLHQIDLIDTPVVSVSQVIVDGEELAPDAYRVDDWRWLTRLDGESWPRCADLLAASDEPGAFVVTWTYGVPVPPGGKQAAAALACQLAKRCIGDDNCEIPDRITNLSGEGVSMSFLPPIQGLLDAGRTGVFVTDLWLHSLDAAPSPPPQIVDPLKTRPVATGGPDGS